MGDLRSNVRVKLSQKTAALCLWLRWLTGKLIPWPCFKTLLSHSSCKLDNQWAMAALVLWIFCCYWGKKGSTVTSLSWLIWDLKWSWKICQCQEHSGRRLHDPRVTGEKSLMTSLEHNSCRTSHDKSRTGIFGLFWGLQNSRKILFTVNLNVLHIFHTSTNSMMMMMEELIFLVTALETAEVVVRGQNTAIS